MFNIGSQELVVILFVVLMLFGAKRIPEVARSVGSGMREFRKAMRGIEDELRFDDPRPQSRPEPRRTITASAAPAAVAGTATAIHPGGAGTAAVASGADMTSDAGQSSGADMSSDAGQSTSGVRTAPDAGASVSEQPAASSSGERSGTTASAGRNDASSTQPTAEGSARTPSPSEVGKPASEDAAS